MRVITLILCPNCGRKKKYRKNCQICGGKGYIEEK